MSGGSRGIGAATVKMFAAAGAKVALAFERMTAALAVVGRHFPAIIAVGGAVMIVLGLLILTGEFTTLNAKANALLHGTGLDVSGI